jgi:hypothetical protein
VEATAFTVRMDYELFDSGPPLAWQKALRLVRPPEERQISRPVLAAVVVGWLPIAVLAGALLITGHPTALSFFTDIAVHARFLLALPLIVLAEVDVIPAFGRIVTHFLSSGMVDRDKEGYFEAVNSTRRLLDSKWATYITFALAYAAVIALITSIDRNNTPAWYWGGPGPLGLSLPGVWHAFVSLPLLLWPCFGWAWRLLLWWRFLARMSRLDLRLIPTHPDHAGGLKFVSTSIRAYRLLAAAIGVIVAGTAMNHALRSGVSSPLAYRNSAIAVVVLVLLLSAGPLLMFVTKLRNTRLRGMLHYGRLGSAVGAEFEQKWISQKENVDTGTLEVPDFSAMTDLYQVVGNVYEVMDVPFGLKDLTPVVVAALMPFVPVVLMTVPLSEIVQTVKSLLL